MRLKAAGVFLVICGLVGAALGLSAGEIAKPSVQVAAKQAIDCFDSGSRFSSACQERFEREDNVRLWTSRGYAVAGISILLIIGGAALLIAGGGAPKPSSGE